MNYTKSSTHSAEFFISIGCMHKATADFYQITEVVSVQFPG